MEAGFPEANRAASRLGGSNDPFDPRAADQGAEPPVSLLLGHVRQKRDGSGALDGRRELALMLGTGAGHAPGENLAALTGEAAEPEIGRASCRERV